MSPRWMLPILVCGALMQIAPTTTLAEEPTRPSREEVQWGEHSRQRFVIWHAKGPGPHPVLVHYFGGAFSFGSPSGGPFKGDLMKRGVTVVGAGYRFRQDGASKLDILTDGARVIQYLRLHADEFDIDPDRIVVSGYSSGGVVASWVAHHDDLREPDHSEPLRRQSSRVSACCLEGAQVHAVDMASWERYTGSPTALLQQGIFNFILLRLYGTAFADPIDPEDYATEPEYQQALQDYQHETFSFYLCSADDPPTCFYCNDLDDPSKYVRRGNGGGLHSPLLMIPMQRRLTELGVPVHWGKKSDCRDFLLTALSL